MPLSRMPTALPPRPVRTQCEPVRTGFAQPEFDLSDTGARRAQRTDEKRDSLRWSFTLRIAPFFDRACEAWCRDHDAKASTLADEMGVGASVLSEMRAAKRLIGAEHLEVLRAHQPARAILAEADRPRPELTMASIERTVLRVVVEDAERGDRGASAILDEVARRLQVERGELAEVIEQGDQHERSPGQADS